MHHVRLGKDVRIADALTFLASDRSAAEDAYAGDIIGLHNHGTINIGDSFTEGEKLGFTGIPNFAPEMFRRAVLKDPLKMKALSKGLGQLCEEERPNYFGPCVTTIRSSVRWASCSSRWWRFGCRMNTPCNVHSNQSTCRRRAGSSATTPRSSRNFGRRPTITSRWITAERSYILRPLG